MYVASNGVKCLTILPDYDPQNPRNSSYQENLGTMVCWHSRYELGDAHHFEDPHEFAMDLAKGACDQDIFSYIQNGKCRGLRAVPSEDREGAYEIHGCWDPYRKDSEWTDSGWRFKDGKFFPESSYIYDDRFELFAYLDTVELLTLASASNTVALKPLYLYDHSGLALSTGSFIGRAHHAEWDSGCIGFIYMEKDTALKQLATAADTFTICKVFADNDRPPTFLSKRDGLSAADVFSHNGFSPVKREDIKNLFDSALNTENKSLINENLLLNHQIFKKGNTLYCYPGDEFDVSYQLKPIALFNPDLQCVTEDTWKSRAEEVLEGEVREYDSFLRGDVYGYVQYEGLEEIDSCWGFNPCGEDIRGMLEDMVGDWGNELKEKMLQAPYDPSDRFDIDDYYASHDFPGLRGKIRRSVIEHLQQQAAGPSPYGTSISDLLADRDSLLTNITEALYDQHLIPTSDTIHETIQEHAGISRARKPKLTRDDLDPSRDYTEDELLAILKSKPTLDTLIGDAKGRQCSTLHSTIQPSHEHAL